MAGKTVLGKQPHLIPATIAAIMLLLALAPFPYGYYQLLRVVVCGAGLYVAFTALNWQRMWAVWVFGFVAVLFNPLIPIHLSREIWQPIDVICGILFIAIAIIFNKPVKNCAPDKKANRESKGSRNVEVNKTFSTPAVR